MVNNSPSFSNAVWQRLKRKRWALAGLVIILLFFLISLFAYVIAPDHTPFADVQTVEIQAKSPGYTQQFLKIPVSQTENSFVLSQILFGKKNNYVLLPIKGYRVAKDSIVVNKFIDDDTAVMQTFSLKALHENANSIHKKIVVKTFWLGTDNFGRDILSRIIIGTRVSLGVGLIAVFVSLSLGILLGALAGYYGKKIDTVIMWLINVTWSIPTLLLVFALTLALGKSFWQIFIAVGLTLWVSVARLVRGQVMAIKGRAFVQAAKSMGFSNFRIIVYHILPNIAGPLLVIAASNFATAIVIEAGLSFLGIGVQPPQPSWGLMIKENYNFIITDQPFLAIIPGLAIMMLVLAFHLVGNGLRDAVDVNNS